MSQSQVIDLAIDQAEVTSVADVTSKICTEAFKFAEKWDSEISAPPHKVEADLIHFIVKRKLTKLTRLRVTILEDGGIAVGGNIKGRRKADLIFRISYKQGGVIKA